MYLDERLRLSPLRLSSVLMYILVNYCDAPELAVVEDCAMVVAGPHRDSSLKPPLVLQYVGETLNQTAPVHRVLVPTIVVWKPEDKGKKHVDELLHQHSCRFHSYKSSKCGGITTEHSSYRLCLTHCLDLRRNGTVSPSHHAFVLTGMLHGSLTLLVLVADILWDIG
ncbi:hypothetical protein BKA83DRAFT_3166577 [Pisolithus microcarpus]|nr:hypothetical protein BKA83DRAFT_3166577 [Pisolithus microcarpus]